MIGIIGADGVARLDELQGLDAVGVHAAKETRCSDDGALYRWRGVMGGFVPNLSSNFYTPSKNKDGNFTKDTSAAEAINAFESGWASWARYGGAHLDSSQWKALVRPTDELARQRSEDLTFIETLTSLQPPSGEGKAILNTMYSLMQFDAITGARTDLAAQIDVWHDSYPAHEVSQQGITIAKCTSARGNILQAELDKEANTELEEARKNYHVLKNSVHTRQQMTDFTEMWTKKGYNNAYTNSFRLHITRTYIYTCVNVHSYTLPPGSCWAHTTAPTLTVTPTGQSSRCPVVILTS
jgi:hypothetical protein